MQGTNGPRDVNSARADTLMMRMADAVRMRNRPLQESWGRTRRLTRRKPGSVLFLYRMYSIPTVKVVYRRGLTSTVPRETMLEREPSKFPPKSRTGCRRLSRNRPW